jgi:hypothetical protein
MSKGFVYTISLTVLMMFLMLVVNSLINSYQSTNEVFNEFVIGKKSVDDYLSIKYSLQRILGVNEAESINISFPFTLSSQDISPRISLFVDFVNNEFAEERFSSVSVNASELACAVDTNAVVYTLLPQGVSVAQQSGVNDKIVISNISALKGLYVKLSSDAIVANNYWEDPGYTPGSFNFVFDEIGVPLNYSLDTGFSANYRLELEKDAWFSGLCNIYFSASASTITIEEVGVDFGRVDYLNFTLKFFFDNGFEIVSSPSVTVMISDWLNKTRINGTI